MLHWHVVALFYHWVLVRYVGPWANNWSSAWLIDVAVLSFIFETALACVEYNCILQMLVTGLAEGCRSPLSTSCHAINCQLIVVFTWSWNFKFQTCSVEDLVRVEPRRCHIESNFLPGKCFVISGPHLLCPVRSFAEAGDHTLNCGANTSGIITIHRA